MAVQSGQGREVAVVVVVNFVWKSHGTIDIYIER